MYPFFANLAANAHESPRLFSTITEWLPIVWLTVVGGAIGSFMNVVVYRLPRGLSIVHPASRCPHCGKPVRPRDNIPVISWFLLRGRCRDCGGSVSARYLFVEGSVAVLFAWVGLVDARIGAAWRTLAESRPPFVFDAALWGLIGCHLLLLCTLICTALIHCDGHRTSLRLFAPALAVGLIASVLGEPLVQGQLTVTPADGTASGPFWPLADIHNALGGFAVGVIIGIFAVAGAQPHKRFGGQGINIPAASCCPIVPWSHCPIFGGRDVEIPAASALVGVYLGWRGVLALGSVTAGVCFVQSLARRPFPRLVVAPWSVWFTLAATAYVLGQDWIVEQTAVLARLSPWLQLIVGMLTVTALSLLTRAAVATCPQSKDQCP